MLHIVTAANSGIGLALAKLLAKQFPQDEILLSHRSQSLSPELMELRDRFPGRVHLHCLEAKTISDYQALSERIGQIGATTLGYVFHTIGCLEDEILQRAERKIDECDNDKLSHAFAVNCLSAVQLAKALFPLLRKSPDCRFVCLSAKVGSIGDNATGGWYAYRMSKAALNMFCKNLAVELGRYNKTARVLAIHPGTTDTALTKNYLKAAQAKYEIHSPEASASHIFSVAQTASPEHSGQFLNWDGSTLPF